MSYKFNPFTGVFDSPRPQVYQATYYKTEIQLFPAPGGNLDLTFNATAPWSNHGNYMTFAAGSANLVVAKTGLYELSFNVSVGANAATWNTGTSKSISIDITRSPESEQATIAQTAFTSSTLDYSQSVSSPYFLSEGDILNFRVASSHAGQPTVIRPLSGAFDLNTWFSWRFIG